MDVASDLGMLIRNISLELSGGETSTTALYGRVVGYHQDSNNIQVAIPHYAASGGSVPILSVPVGCFMVGAGYGDYFFAEIGVLCILLVIEADTGDSIHGFLLNDATALPPDLQGDANTPTEPLQAGDRIIMGKNGQVIRFSPSGDLQLCCTGEGPPSTAKLRLGSRSSEFGTTPVAVEGSTATHNHDLSIFYSSFSAAITAAAAAQLSGNPTGSAALTALVAALTSVFGPPGSPPTAAAPVTAIFAATIDSKDGGPLASGTGGAQSVLAPGPGES